MFSKSPACDFHFFPGATFIRIRPVVREPLVEKFAMPIGNGNLGFVHRDAIPQRLDIVDLFFDGHFVESWGRKQRDLRHRLKS
jgi:hypothetical protein